MANRYWVGGNANWDSTAGTKWATTSGGVGGSAVPTSTDDVFLDNGVGTGNVTLASGYAANCKSLVCTGYVGTLASANTTGSCTVAGAITFVAGMTLSITNTMSATTTATLTSGGKTFAGILILGGAGAITHTLADNWTISGTLRFTGNTSLTINGFTLYTSGNLEGNTNGGIIVNGTTNIQMTGTGTWSHTTSGYIYNNLTFNSAGTITISGNVYKATNTLLYTAGTLVWTGSTLNIGNGAATTTVLTLGAQTPNNLTFSSSTAVITLSANLTITGNYTVTGNASATINGFILYIGGSLSINLNASVSQTGTTNIEMNGTGTWSHSTTGYLTNNLTINTAGTFTVSGNVYKNGGTILYTAGTTVWTSSTLQIYGNTTLTLGTQQPFNIVSGATFTTTLSANLTITGTLSTPAGGASTATINGFKIFVGGSLTIVASTALAGTTDIEMNGTGTWACANSSCTVSNNITINTAGTITISGNVYKVGAATSITYTAGTVVTTGSTLNISADITLNTNGMSWNNISPTGTRTLTINSLLTVTGTWTCVATTTFAGSSGWTITNWTCITAGVTVTFANGKTYTLSGGTMTNTGTAAGKILFTSDHATIKAILTLTGVTQSNVYLSGTRMDSSLGATVWTVGGVLTTTLNWNLLTSPATVASGFVN